jgi:GntR family transcriptional repressor for pyruvate dehydrogenase complex
LELAEYESSSGIRRLSAAEEVFKVLHEWIVSGKFKPGEHLPSQDQLARQLGVSRNTLREAIYKLTVMGLLTSKQGVGTVVNITSASNYMASLADHLHFEASTVREFFEARVFIEKSTVVLAAMRAASDDLSRLEKTLTLQEEAFRAGDLDAFSRRDAAFHLVLARSAGNSVLLKFLETLREMLNRFIVEVARLPDAMEKALLFHRQILDAVSSRDADGAERIMVNHLRDIALRIEKNTHADLGIGKLFGNDKR